MPRCSTRGATSARCARCTGCWRSTAAVASDVDQLTHPAYTKPELLALAPNQVWSWDITKLKGPAKWTCFHLYVILDIFSRHVVGWLIAERESAELAEQLIADTVARHDVEPGMLTLHADRGASMRSKPVAALLVDLDIAKSHSRPHVSDDNPYSESQFKTMKYRPDFPARFGCIEDARAHCQAFFAWYNTAHRHSGIGYMTPHSVHYGHAEALHGSRQATLDAAFLARPNALQGPPSATPCAAHRSVDQPAIEGDNDRSKTAALHSKFMTPGAAKSLTRSAASPRLPAGYVLLLFASFFPPLWRWLMLPALESWIRDPHAHVEPLPWRLVCLPVHYEAKTEL